MSFFCTGDEPKSGLARDLCDRLQSRNVPFGTSGDLKEVCVNNVCDKQDQKDQADGI